jgi:osmotically-inducible protein OsmY
MKRVRSTLAIGALALAFGTHHARAASPEEAAPQRAENEATDADNTGRNVRDRGDAALTPTEQGESASDRKITQEVRQAVVAHDDLSMNAKNAKIITRDGVVTLRGPVKSPAEKTQLGALAAKAPGVKRVDNQLEIENER